MLILPMLLGAFDHRSPDNRICCDSHWMNGYILSCTVIIFRPEVCARSVNSGWIVLFPGDGCVNIFVALKESRRPCGAGSWSKSSKQHG